MWLRLTIVLSLLLQFRRSWSLLQCSVSCVVRGNRDKLSTWVGVLCWLSWLTIVWVRGLVGVDRTRTTIIFWC